MDLVLYHGNCYDGFGAAYCAWKNLGDNAEYYPVNYGDSIDKEGWISSKKFETCYILDFSYPENDILFLIENVADKIVLLDHHKTAQHMLKPLIGKYTWLDIEFDMKRSGALMAWDYFMGTGPCETSHRQFIRHISDRDLWSFNIAGTKELHQFLLSNKMDFKDWDRYADNLYACISEGGALLKQYNQLVQNIISKAWIKDIGGYEVPVVNTSIAWSEVGNELCKKYSDYPFAASFTIFENQVMWSLRSIGYFDVSEIAKKFGGGGHSNAAGFKTQRM